ncbi:sterol desaturase family protein [Methylocystis sp. B8]|uniref:sterol desaturase family protein n=1 Tax=Methylocystis sp. B8 TaxID=544938 RepID=UPI0010FF3816|nr:sterol desaturase family protein [Methylocystis sp. B8]TLG79013.1 sterol desaturase family protein [Methylocystis sp. B8]
MDINDALRFSVARISNELFSAGSIFSVYSLATTFLIAVCALAYQRKMRRGRVNLRVIARAIFNKRILLTKSSAADVKLFFLSVVLMPVVVGALVISTNAVAIVVSGALNGLVGARAPIACCDLSIKVFSTVVLFLAYEIGYWVDHYLKHRIPFLWEFHKVHHTAEVLTPVTNFRNHPIDNIFFGYMLATFIGAASGVLAWVFGRTTESFTVDGKNILFIFFLWTIGHLQHSQFWIPFRGVLGNIILSPAHHQIHHSTDPKHFNRNFGSVLAIWDWMFGSLEIPSTTNPRLKYGVVEEGADPHSVVGILATPIVRAAAALWRAPAEIGNAWMERMEQRRQESKSTSIS